MDGDQVRRVRSFNRAVALSVGALKASYLERGRPLGEARLVFEIGAEGAEARALRLRLGLDSGYMSRMLQSLASQGLVEASKDPRDGRLRRIALTRRGAASFRLTKSFRTGSRRRHLSRSTRGSASAWSRRWARWRGCSARLA
jgi:DNA-binding MarR family transcriptional regulator